MHTGNQERRIIVNGKQRLFSLTTVLLLALGGWAHALDASTLPTGGTITAGSGTISQVGSQMTVDQASQKMIANWSTFNIGQDAVVRFNQPNSSATALNRIQDQNPSQILGKLSANGQVFLLNPAGIIFGRTAQVDVGGLVASSLNLSDADFLAGNNRFANTGSAGAVLNQGSIRAADGGYVAFLAPHVGNDGSIAAANGTVLLAAGDKVSLDFTGDRLVTFTVEQGAIDALAENHGLIKADGGLVVMTAQAADQLTGAVVNNDGVIQAQTLANRAGRILLLADMETGTTTVAGTLNASAPNGGDGGFIETSAAQVKITDDAHITTLAATGETGTWLIDPTNYSIMTGGDISPAALASALTAGNVVIQTADEGTQMGHIYIMEPITWSSANNLTLNAHGDITSYVPITNNAGGNLMLRADLDGDGSGSLYFGGGASISLTGGGRADLYYNPISYAAPTNFSAVMGSTSYTAWMLVNDVYDLQAMSTNRFGAYALGRDVDAAATATWNSGAGFEPVGNAGGFFWGQLDGQNHTISNLTINRSWQQYVGLFGWVSPVSQVRNVGMLGGNVSGGGFVGFLAGRNEGMVINTYATGSVTGNQYVGGLVGHNTFGSLSSSYATGSVNGGSLVGGLVGENLRGSIATSHAAGTVTGSGDYIGGLVGMNNNGYPDAYYTAVISRCYATGNVSGSNSVGGLVGHNNYGSMNDVYAWGNILGHDTPGGLLGSNYGQVINAYAIGSVTGFSHVGGLVGYNNNYGILDKTYAAGLVTLTSGGAYAGGLAGWTYPGSRISNSYWDTQTTGQAAAIGLNWGGNSATPRTTAQMTRQAGYASWDFTNTWRIYETYSYPVLRSLQQSLLTVTANNDSKTYDGVAYSGGNGVSYSVAGASLVGTLSYGGTSQGSSDAGSYTITPQVALAQQDYQNWVDIAFVGGTLTVDPAALTVTANDASKTYDGLTYSGGNGVSYSGFVNDENATVLGGTLAYAGTSQGAVDAGSYVITPEGLTSGNYTITFNDGTLAVDPAALTVTANNDGKTYDGLAYSGGNDVSYSGFVTGEDETVLGGTLAYGGSSQGAVLPGDYVILPEGLTSSNYTIAFVEGGLTIEKPSPSIDAIVASLTSPQNSINGTQQDPAGSHDPAAIQDSMGAGGGSGTLDDLAALQLVTPPCNGSLRDTAYCR